MISPCRLWVNRVGFAMSALRPLIPQKQPSSGHQWTSQKCQQETFREQGPGHKSDARRCPPSMGHSLITRTCYGLSDEPLGWEISSGAIDHVVEGTLSRKSAKKRTHGRKLRSTGTKAKGRVGRILEPRAELEKKLA